MKKGIVLFSLFFVSLSLSLYSAEPILKLYHIDGSTKEYKLNEIDSLSVFDKKNNYVLRIHYDDSLIAYYPTEIIGSIKFENESLNVYIFSYPKPYKISSIDSLIFYIDQWQPLTIGSQVWMLKNLNVDHYRNGDSIPEVIGTSEWKKLLTGAWCYYAVSDSIGKIYNKLYNWYAVNDIRGLAPIGWHIPNRDEFYKLLKFLDDNPYRKLKSKGTREEGNGLWYSPNYGAKNSCGFSALPGGNRGMDGQFSQEGYNCILWLSSEAVGTGNCVFLDYDGNGGDGSGNKKTGFSVRCVKDGK